MMHQPVEGDPERAPFNESPVHAVVAWEAERYFSTYSN